MSLRREPRPGSDRRDASMAVVEYGVALVAFIAVCLLTLARG
jgi:Flp pilus assembly pilin Flp